MRYNYGSDRSVQGTEIAVDGWEDCRLFPWHNVSSRVMCLFLCPTAFRHLDNDAVRRVSAISRV